MRKRYSATLGLLAVITFLPAFKVQAVSRSTGIVTGASSLDSEHVRPFDEHPRSTGSPKELTISASSPCGHRVEKPSYSHVMWVFMENESLVSIIGAADSPYATRLARRCGLAVDYNSITHPSLPNYLAATGGKTFGVTDDGEPATHPISGGSIFSELATNRLTWRSYAESMPRPCETVTSGLYAARHNPAVYYTAIRATCARDDIAMGSLISGPLHRALYSDKLANFVFVTPNICDDAHSCPVSHGDQWLSRFLATVFASPTYRLEHMAVFVVWDEGNVNNLVPAIVAAPSVPIGTRSRVFFSHYSLLRTTEQLLGVRLIANSAKANSMVTAFDL